jgi:subtilisin-like proprotein convertase family protein
MKKVNLFIVVFLSVIQQFYSQTFTGDSGDILDNQTVNIPLLVTVPETEINTINFGLESVCIDIQHTYLSDLIIELVAPDGTVKLILQNVGGGDDNFENTCFNTNASATITEGVAPFSGVFKPMGQIGAVNNGQNPNGIWYLRITDTYEQDQGIVLSWSITFGDQPATYFQFTNSTLPIVVIETNGVEIPYDEKANVDMGIIYNGVGQVNAVSDPFNEYSGKIGIEYRGNFSLGLPQKPYSIELRDSLGNNRNESLLGMPAENDWLLLANYNDKSFARNVLPQHLFEKMGNYAVRSRFVDVVLDGEYQGIYLLAEKIKKDSNRVDVPTLNPTEISGQDVTGGYIIKVDYWNENDSWQSSFSPLNAPGLDIHFVYYYPSPDSIAPQQKQYIQNFVNEFETTLYGSNFDNPSFGYARYIDVESFIDYFIINEFTRNEDGYKKSRFFHKDKDKASGEYRKLKAGPVWDFDWALKDINWGSEDGSDFMYDLVDQDVNAPGWYIRLLQDSMFANQLHCRYANLRNSILSEDYLFAQIDSVANVVNQSQVAHYLIWGHLGTATGTPEVQAPSQTYEEEVVRLKAWISRRLEWLDANMPGSTVGCSFAGLQMLSSTDFLAVPNPFTDELVVYAKQELNERIVVTWHDELGRVVNTQVIEPTFSKQISLKNLEGLAPGLYTLSIQSERISSTLKVMRK